MSLSGFTLPPMENEPVLGYLPGSPERKSLQDELERQSQEVVEIPCIIDGEEVWTGNIVEQVMPHKHAHVIARVHLAGEKEIRNAIEASLHVHQSWSSLPWQERAAVFIKAADLLAGERRAEINASTMLNQSKTCHQAEIDSACELIDFWRLNAHFAQQIYQDIQPPISPEGIQNSCEGRALEGFIFAVTPFNFTSIAGNLPSAPALMGNTAVWKPSRNSYLSNYKIMQLMMDAGLPAGVINFVPARASEISDICMSHPMLAGIHFTGSTGVSTIYGHMWVKIYPICALIHVSSEKPVVKTSLLHILIAKKKHSLRQCFVGPLNSRVRNARRHLDATSLPRFGSELSNHTSKRFPK